MHFSLYFCTFLDMVLSEILAGNISMGKSLPLLPYAYVWIFMDIFDKVQGRNKPFHAERKHKSWVFGAARVLWPIKYAAQIFNPFFLTLQRVSGLLRICNM